MGALKTLEKLRNKAVFGYSAENGAIFEHNGVHYVVDNVVVLDEELEVFFDIAKANNIETDDIPTWGEIVGLLCVDDEYSAWDDFDIIEEIENELKRKTNDSKRRI